VSTTATTGDLETFLALAPGSIGTVRAQMILDMIEADALTIISPLPAAAKSVVLTVAARAYVNPENNLEESAGTVSTRYGWRGSGGMYLTRQERRTLRRMAGIGAGAFTVDPTAATAMTDYVDALTPPTVDDSEQLVLDQPDPFIGP